jgi:AAA+ ATPase superfamily predicted ATPase
MTKNRLLEQFRSFYFQNYPDDMETQIAYFAIFGGLNWDIDTTQPISELIENLILKNFVHIDAAMRELTRNDTLNRKLLKAIAIGDRRIFSAFNKAGLNNKNGGIALNYLQEKGLIQIEYSRERHPREKYPKTKLKRQEARHRISHKVLFTHPFIRFWFYFVVPHIKEIKAQEYDNFFKDFQTRHNSYTSLVYEELSEILLNYHLRDEIIISSGSYWDANLEIDILTLTQNERFYVGECKWTNHKINKKELHKIKDKCMKLGIEPTQIIFFSKRGFSKELLCMQGASLALYSSEDFQALVKSKPQGDLYPLITFKAS